MKDFIREYFYEFIFILLLFIPYFIVLHLGKDVVCIYEFANRYDMVYVPLLLILLIPLVRNFHRFGFAKRVFFIAIIVWSFYVQLLGSSVSILYYANVIEVCLGEWQKYLFYLRFSPFVVYPRLILQGITGLAIYIKGLSNVSGSIDFPFKLDYFWYNSDMILVKFTAGILLFVWLCLSFYIFRYGNIVETIKKYFKELLIVIVVFVVWWLMAFVPKEIFTKTKKSMIPISNSSFEVIENSEDGNKIPLGWQLIDWSKQSDMPSVVFSTTSFHVVDGKTGLEIVMNQSYVTISLTSQLFEIKEGEVIEGSCFIKSDKNFPCTVRISISGDDDSAPFYYAPTTKVYKIGDGWRKYVCKVLVPKGAKKAHFLINIWGGRLEKGSKVYVDGVNVVRYE